MSDKEPTFREAVLDMGSLFSEMQKMYRVPPSVTMDIVRLQLMYMQQSQAINTQQPTPEDTDVVEVITGDEEDTDE